MVSRRTFFRAGSFLLLLLHFHIPIPWNGDGHVQAEDSMNFCLATLQGEMVNLKDYRGDKVVHLVFWSTWCPKCLMDMGTLKRYWATRGTRPYEIVAINVGLNESQDRITKIKQQYQMPFSVVLDNKGAVTRDFGVISIPCNIIIDREGAIRDRFHELPEDPEVFFKRLFEAKED